MVKKLKDKSTSYFSVIDEEAKERLRLQQVWLEARPNFLADSQQHNFQIMLSESIDDMVDILRQFCLLIKKGITPPVHILVPIAISIGNYLDSDGRETLDQTFKLKNKQGKHGKPLKNKKFREERQLLLFQMAKIRYQFKKSGKKLPAIEKVAGDIINQFNLSIQEEVLKKDYINTGTEEIFFRAFDALKAVK